MFTEQSGSFASVLQTWSDERKIKEAILSDEQYDERLRVLIEHETTHEQYAKWNSLYKPSHETGSIEPRLLRRPDKSTKPRGVHAKRIKIEGAMQPAAADGDSVVEMDGTTSWSARSPDSLRPKEMDQEACLSYLDSCSLPIPTPPTLANMRSAIAAHLKAIDGYTTQLQDLLRPGGHELLWTPPYESDTQPIELYWAMAKSAVARTITGSRSADKMRAAVDDAMLAVTPEECRRLISHVQRWIDDWLSDAEQGGQLAQRYPSLASMVSAALMGSFDTTGLLD